MTENNSANSIFNYPVLTEEKQRYEGFIEKMEADIMASDMPEQEKNKYLKNFLYLREQKVNILITGATGSGKSSTINALFNTEMAKVGVGVDPETTEIEKYELDNLVLWDSPGLGDGKEADERNRRNIIQKLRETDENGDLLIDLVLVVLDAGSKDLGTSYELINKVIIPNLGEEAKDRILVGINQADMAMKGRYWNNEENCPEPRLLEFLKEKVESVRARIKEATGIDIEPIFYCAGYTDGEESRNPYNLAKLLYYIVKYTPEEKRLAVAFNLNDDEEMFEDNEDFDDYDNYDDEDEEESRTFGEGLRDLIYEGFEKTLDTVGITIGIAALPIILVKDFLRDYFGL